MNSQQINSRLSGPEFSPGDGVKLDWGGEGEVVEKFLCDIRSFYFPQNEAVWNYVVEVGGYEYCALGWDMEPLDEP